MTQDKRDAARIPYAVQVVFRTTSSFLVAYSVNLSRGGMFLEAQQPLAIGAELMLRIEIVGAGEFALPARVTWRREATNAEGPCGFGVEFITPISNFETLIDDMVSRFSGLQFLVLTSETAERSSLARTLRAVVSSADIVAAPDASIGIGLIDDSIDLIVVDADYSQVDSSSLIKHANNLQPPIPTVVLASDSNVRNQMRELGAHDAMRNPPRFNDFQKLVVQALSRPRTASA